MLIQQDPDGYREDIQSVRSWFQTWDGHELKFRLIQPLDAELLIELFDHLSSEARRRRFHMGADHVSEERKNQVAWQLANVDNRTQGGAVLALDTDENGQVQVVGVARLARPAGHPEHSEAEAAVVVRDDFQGRGVGTELLRRMVLLAKQMQVQTIAAVIEADNADAIRLFRELNLPTELSTSHAETELRVRVPD